MLPDWIVVGFSGCQEVSKPDIIAKSISAVLDRMMERRSFVAGISSTVDGSGPLFVEEILKRKLPLTLVRPIPQGQSQKTCPPDNERRLESMLSKASWVEEINGNTTDEDAYVEAGSRIVDRADVLIAVWDGKPSVAPGETADVIAYSRELAKPVIWINSETGVVQEEGLDGLPQVAKVTDWSGDPRQTIENHFQELDEAASLRAPKVRHFIQQVILLHLLALAAGVTAAVTGIHGLAGYGVSFVEVAALVTAFVLTILHQRPHGEWMRFRIEAEVCRSFLAMWPMRRWLDYCPKPAIQGFSRLIRNLRFLQQLDATPRVPLEIARREYLEKRLRDQIDYFSRQSKKAHRTYLRLRGLAMGSTAAAALLAIGHFVLSFNRRDASAYVITELLSLVLPLVSTAIFSLILTQEHLRRAVRYEEMVSSLKGTAKRAEAVRTLNDLTRIATEAEAELLQEAFEWHSYRRFASEPH